MNKGIACHTNTYMQLYTTYWLVVPWELIVWTILGIRGHFHFKM